MSGRRPALRRRYHWGSSSRKGLHLDLPQLKTRRLARLSERDRLIEYLSYLTTAPLMKRSHQLGAIVVLLVLLCSEPGRVLALLWLPHRPVHQVYHVTALSLCLGTPSPAHNNNLYRPSFLCLSERCGQPCRVRTAQLSSPLTSRLAAALRCKPPLPQPKHTFVQVCLRKTLITTEIQNSFLGDAAQIGWGRWGGGGQGHWGSSRKHCQSPSHRFCSCVRAIYKEEGHLVLFLWTLIRNPHLLPHGYLMDDHQRAPPLEDG